ncbi:MAG: hypothetical protein F4X25_03460 [Chloroflexi bacterium]|nr:hypothetical protein [Chloroflexota bacterium]
MALSSMFKCPSCGGLFDSRYRMERHQVDRHGERSIDAKPVAPDVAGYLNLEDLARAVHEHEVIVVSMGELRNTYGAERLGVDVRERIHRGLLGCELGHFPTPLPRDQRELVVIYEWGGPVPALVRKAIGDPHDSSVEMSRFISQLVRLASRDRVKLNAIRDVLGQASPATA